MELKPNAEVFEKIKKLLALAQSDNENEAKLATERANELLIKYNISMSKLEGYEPEYDTQSVADVGLTYKPYQSLITMLVEEFFFVSVIISHKYVGQSSGQWGKTRGRFNKIIQFIGTKENIEIASYVWSFLNRTYPELWKYKYDRDSSLSPKDKYSYFLGLTKGIRTALERTKFRVEEEYGLVLVKDPKLKELQDLATEGREYGTNHDKDIDIDAYRKGVKDGQSVNIRKPIESSKSNEGSTKMLGLKT